MYAFSVEMQVLARIFSALAVTGASNRRMRNLIPVLSYVLTVLRSCSRDGRNRMRFFTLIERVEIQAAYR